ncbi:MAG: hypothetical protein WC967_12685 [Balneolaceae bacterium]
MNIDFTKLEEMSEQEREVAMATFLETGSKDVVVAQKAQETFAAAIKGPIRSGLLSGDIIHGIFTPEQMKPDVPAIYPVDLFTAGNANDFAAYTIPNEGRIPQRHVEGDYITVPMYSVGNAIDWLLKFNRNARWGVIGRALEVFEGGFVKKMNTDGWHCLLAAGVDRNILVSDSDATAGLFTKRLVSLLKLTMRRNSGGNSATPNRGRLTHLFMGPEALEDIRNWGVDQADDITRREIFVAKDGSINSVFGVNLVDLDELGEGQEYQNYYTDVLSASMASNDVEIVVGLDLSNKDSFVMPIDGDVEVYNDPYLHREQRMGVYGWANLGFGCLDTRRVIIGSL